MTDSSGHSRLTGTATARVIHPDDPDHPGTQVKAAGAAGPDDAKAAEFERAWLKGFEAAVRCSRDGKLDEMIAELGDKLELDESGGPVTNAHP